MLPLRLRWAAALYGKLRAGLAITGGVHTGADAIKALLAGADIVQIVSALVTKGPRHIATIRQEMEAWMNGRGLASLADFRGSLSLDRVLNRDTFERLNYVGILREQTVTRGPTHG